MTESRALTLWRDQAEADFPLRGPKRAKEYFQALHTAGESLLQHLEFIRKSGVPGRGVASREHMALMDILRHLVAHDMLDITICAGAEMVVRRLYVLEQAVSRSPKAPDWEGLEVVQSHP